MSTSLFSLIFAGVVGSGVFVGTLQQNVLKTEKPYIDILFEEIEKDIREFSRENPLTKEEAKKIKEDPKTSSTEIETRRKRRDVYNGGKESKNTLEVWTDIWVGLLGDYIQSLWTTNNMTSYSTIDEKSKNFSNQQKQEAIEKADDGNKKEKERFETKLSEKRSEIEDIYKRMKDFILKIEFPENYKYNKSDSTDAPYENYVRAIK